MNDTTEKNANGKDSILEHQPKFSTVLTAFANLDKVCYQLGLLNKQNSLTPEINDTLQDKNYDLATMLKKLDNSRDHIEQQIVQLKTMMTTRCLMVLSWEFIVIFIFGSSLLTASYFAGYWSTGTFSPSWLIEILTRPIFITVCSLLLVIGFIILHYSLRNYFAYKIAKKLDVTDTNFTLAKAFLLNSKFFHSIFRPEPIGLHWLNRKRLQQAHDLFLSQPNNE